MSDGCASDSRTARSPAGLIRGAAGWWGDSLFAEGAVRSGLVPVFGDAAHADLRIIPRGAAVLEQDGAALLRRRLRHDGGAPRGEEGCAEHG